MNRCRMMASLVVLWAWATANSDRVSATEFAVLLGSPPKQSDPDLVVVNPLYTPKGTQSNNPLFEPNSLYFSPSQLWQGEPTQFVVKINDSLPTDLPPAPLNSFVFEASLFRQADGTAIHALAQPVQIGVDLGSPDLQSFEFGYLDTSGAAPQWVAQGVVSNQGSATFYCGTTDHFSDFYITAVPEPSTGILFFSASLGLAWAIRRRRR